MTTLPVVLERRAFTEARARHALGAGAVVGTAMCSLFALLFIESGLTRLVGEGPAGIGIALATLIGKSFIEWHAGRGRPSR